MKIDSREEQVFKKKKKNFCRLFSHLLSNLYKKCFSASFTVQSFLQRTVQSKSKEAEDLFWIGLTDSAECFEKQQGAFTYLQSRFHESCCLSDTHHPTWG